MTYQLSKNEAETVSKYLALAMNCRDTFVATDSQLILWSSEAKLSENASNAVLNIAEFVRQEPELHKLFRALHYGLFHTADSIAEPDLEKNLGVKNGRAFYLLLALSGLTDMRQLYQEKQYDDKMRREITGDWGIWARHNFNNSSTHGLRWGILSWLRCHVKGEVLQFGRLQCNSRAEFPGKLTVYRNKKTNKVFAVSDGNIRCISGGFMAREDEKEAFVSSVEQSGNILKGHIIEATGFIRKRPEEIDLSDCVVVLKPGDEVINLHIPESGALSVEECANSVERMKNFFREKYPEFNFKGFICLSWLLDGQLRNVLPIESNIIKFQNAGYLFPFTPASDAVFRVFGEKGAEEGYKNVPHQSSMQRRMANFLDLGNSFRQGGIFLLNEDLPWGSNPYI